MTNWQSGRVIAYSQATLAATRSATEIENHDRPRRGSKFVFKVIHATVTGWMARNAGVSILLVTINIFTRYSIGSKLLTFIA
jgi:hypothetical protein